MTHKRLFIQRRKIFLATKVECFTTQCFRPSLMFSGKAKSGVPLRQSIWICSYLQIFMLRRKGMPETKMTELQKIFITFPQEKMAEKKGSSFGLYSFDQTRMESSKL